MSSHWEMVLRVRRPSAYYVDVTLISAPGCSGTDVNKNTRPKTNDNLRDQFLDNVARTNTDLSRAVSNCDTTIAFGLS